MKRINVTVKVRCTNCGKPVPTTLRQPVTLGELPTELRCQRCDRMNVGLHGLKLPAAPDGVAYYAVPEGNALALAGAILNDRATAETEPLVAIERALGRDRDMFAGMSVDEADHYALRNYSDRLQELRMAARALARYSSTAPVDLASVRDHVDAKVSESLARLRGETAAVSS